MINGQIQPWTKEIQDQQDAIKRNIGYPLTDGIVAADGGPEGVLVEIIDGRPVVSIRCSDPTKLDELRMIANRIVSVI